MTGLPSIRYLPPEHEVLPTPWAFDWRIRWFREVGSVHKHWKTGEMVAYYSDERPPAARLALQAELEAVPDGSAQVAAACEAIKDRWNAEVESAYRKEPA